MSREKTIHELIRLAQAKIKDEECKALFLIECGGDCCSLGFRDLSSYRLFFAVPEFDESPPGFHFFRGLHPDTCRNEGIMLCKSYDLPKGFGETITKMVSPDARRLGSDDGVPPRSIIYKLK